MWTDLTADGVSPSPKRAATADHVSAEGLRFVEEMAKRSIWRSRSGVQWYGMIGKNLTCNEVETIKLETLVQDGVGERNEAGKSKGNRKQI